MPKFHVNRSITIDAPAEKVFDVVSDFGTWTTWSPWLCAEPSAKVEVSDNSNSVGSLYQWEGEIVGQGEVEHKRLERGKLIDDEIRFLKPMKAVSQVLFEMEPVGGGTKITWHMKGSLPWFLFWMTSSMEGFIGMDYERGLKMLKELIETGKIETKTTIRGIESVGPLHVAGTRRSCKMSEIGPSMEQAFCDAKAALTRLELPIDGQAISVYHDFNIKSQTLDYTSGFVIPAPPSETPSDVSVWSIGEAKALATEHIGSYAHLGNGWSAANQYARYKKLKQSKVGAYEVYLNDPSNTAPGELKTDIFLPLK